MMQTIRAAEMETAVTPLQRWQVIRTTQTRRVRGDKGEWLQPGTTFFGSWILLGWVKNYDEPRWIKMSDCIKIVSADPPVEPLPAGDVLKWARTDYELLGTPLARVRPNLPGVPMTVNLACKKFGLVPATPDYVRITNGLNGTTLPVLCGIMDSFTPQGAKWGYGDMKVPCEIIFGSNPYSVTALLRNAGGLTGIKAGEWVYELDTLPYDSLYMYDASTVPSKYIMHFTIARNGSPIVNPSPALGGRDGEPVKLLIASRSIMYIKKDLLVPTGTRTNRYNPPWDKGNL